MEIEKYKKLLKQFYQIIFQGPSGTGKTHIAKKLAREMTGDDDPGRYWQIIQFHPSYNYEDFVRGIQVKSESGQVKYETVDRVLIKMAKGAASDNSLPKKPYILIIDEINRANVAAVLGELIYALEYRGQPVRVTYEKDGSADIVLPSNFYIIGTMNTAERTIGQIDYAVRRRFAFETLLPDRNVILGYAIYDEKSNTRANAFELFQMVGDLFEGDDNCLSDDYDKNDVTIGHSYFLAKNNSELRNKMLFQVIPILREYVKDGVLTPKDKAEPKIKEIEDFDSYGESQNSYTPPETLARSGMQSGGKKVYRWQNRHGESEDVQHVSRLILSVVKNYAKNEHPYSIRELKKAFPDHLHVGYGVVQLRNDKQYNRYLKEEGYTAGGNRYFAKEHELIRIGDGTDVMVCNQWGATGSREGRFNTLLKCCQNLGYEIEKI